MPNIETNSSLFQKTTIANINLKNKIFRAATSETAASKFGDVTDKLIHFYEKIAFGKPGLIFTGHMYIEPSGQYAPFQLGITAKNDINKLRELVRTVRSSDVPIVAELSHCGSQSMIKNLKTKAPSVLQNIIYGVQPAEMTEDQIWDVINNFGLSAGIAMEAGFDGIHLHGGNGYLISQFSSPITNKREDKWGGSQENRDRFIVEVYKKVRKTIGYKIFLSARVGIEDSQSDGLSIQEGVERVKKLETLGLDTVEPTYNLMTTYKENIRPFAGITKFISLKSGIFLFDSFRLKSRPEGYYLKLLNELKNYGIKLPRILVGGVRSTDFMKEVLGKKNAEYFALSRPFIREPDLTEKIRTGKIDRVDCVSCNMCFKHEGYHISKCWRKDIISIVQHLVFSFYNKINN